MRRPPPWIREGGNLPPPPPAAAGGSALLPEELTPSDEEPPRATSSWPAAGCLLGLPGVPRCSAALLAAGLVLLGGGGLWPRPAGADDAPWNPQPLGQHQQQGADERKSLAFAEHFVVDLYEDAASLHTEALMLALSGHPKPAPGVPQRYVVYRHRGGDPDLDDDAGGGFGERVAGLWGAAYLALSTGRALKVDWPELAQAFAETSGVRWHYDAGALGLSQADQKILNHSFDEQPNFPDPRFADLSPDVLVLNYWSGHGAELAPQRWRTYPSEVTKKAEASRVLVVSGNRAGTADWLAALQAGGRAPKSCSFWEMYNAMFAALFKPSPAFFGLPIVMEVATVERPRYVVDSSPLSQALEILRRPDTFSLGVQLHAGAAAVEAERQGAACPAADVLMQYINAAANGGDVLGCILNLAMNHLAYSTRVLVVFSDSHCMKQHLLERFRDSRAFTEVWTQGKKQQHEHDEGEASGKPHTFRQTMRDWILMRYVDMFASSTSLESSLGSLQTSALVTASLDKELYQLDICRPVERRTLCSGATFC